MLTALFLVWLQMSAQPETCVTFSSISAQKSPPDHGKLLSTQIACIKTYADGFIEYNPCEISTEPPTTNFVKPVSSDIKFAEAAQRAADETDGKPPNCREFSRNLQVCGPKDPPGSGPLIDNSPVDVPAAQEFGGHIPNVDDRRKCVANSEPAESGVACLSDLVWTCKDKTRVLQFSEDGKKHCIKF